MRQAAFVLAAVLLAVSAALAQSPACLPLTLDQVEPVVRAVVTRASRGFDYRYTLDARAPARRILIRFSVELTWAPAPRIIVPPGWELGGSSDAPLPQWSRAGARPGVPGGTRVEGFGFAGAGPPDYCRDDERASKHARTRTVGPTASAGPASFGRLAQQVERARDLGWVDPPTAARLRARVERAGRAELDRRRDDRAREVDAVLADLAASACRDFACAEPKAITSEGYALLFFTAEELRRR